MVRLSLNLPDDLHQKASLLSGEQGYASVEEYLRCVIQADIDGVPVSTETEALLVEGLGSPAIPLEQIDWATLRIAK